MSWPGGNTQPTLAFDAPGPTSKHGLPLCVDVCRVGAYYFQPTSNCQYPCGDGYHCEWVTDGGERTALCICSTECGQV